MNIMDTISMLIPLKAEYVSIARLTVSGIASRMGFDIDTIEDIKVALSEVLGKFIEKKSMTERVNVDFQCLEDGISIKFKAPDQSIPGLFDNDTDKFALAIIGSLMDGIEIQKQGDNTITMVKKLGKAV
ncbi:MAG TPA: anti-sigma regulatory factor [Clostridiaceae bacterium]|jgi:serine/threonine-protein kinase RsbW|nr:anti-sigma regulatory factor [Clostridiaceae bacterium]